MFGGHDHAMRQTVIALASGASLNEHENPGEATVHVLSGHIRLVSAEGDQEGRTAELLIVPDGPHSVHALEDSALLLSAVPRAHIG